MGVRWSLDWGGWLTRMAYTCRGTGENLDHLDLQAGPGGGLENPSRTLAGPEAQKKITFTDASLAKANRTGAASPPSYAPTGCYTHHQLTASCLLIGWWLHVGLR